MASLDPEIAEARGLPVRGLGIAFMILLGFAVATAVQLVGVAHGGSRTPA